MADAAVFVPPRRQINPLIPICALGLCLFLIAATIVLALIPVYLLARNFGKQNTNVVEFTTSLAVQNGSLPLGTLNAQDCLAIQTLLRQQAQSSSNVNPSVPSVISCTVSGNAATKKRKKRQSSGNQIDVLGVLSGGGRCHFGSCLIEQARALIALLLASGQVILNLLLANGSRANVAAIFTTGSATEPTANPDIAFLGLNNQNQLLRFNAQNPSSATSTVAVTGLNGNEKLLSIDFRPATGQLFGVTDGSRLYEINQDTGTARQIGNVFNTSLSGSIVSIDFNPTVDRLRLVSNTGQNLRVNPETGGIIGIDGSVTNGTIVAIAYNNNTAGVVNTTLFGIDSSIDRLSKINPPNDGTLVTVGSLGFDASSPVGFDISPDGVALAAVVVGGVSQLYIVNLNTGLLSQYLGNLPQSLSALAIPTDPVAYTILSSNNSLVIFNPFDSDIAPIIKTITGLANGELILGLDFRPQTGQLFGLGNSNRIYAINTATGQATAPGTGTAFTPALSGTAFGFDLNPLIDRFRVVSNTNQSLKIDPDTGSAVADANINPSALSVTAAAYTNNIANATSTVLFVLDSGSNRLLKLNATNGTETDVGPLGIDFNDDNGFDIGGRSNNAFALLTANGTTIVYQINTASGAATSLSTFPLTGSVRAFALGLGF